MWQNEHERRRQSTESHHRNALGRWPRMQQDKRPTRPRATQERGLEERPWLGTKITNYDEEENGTKYHWALQVKIHWYSNCDGLYLPSSPSSDDAGTGSSEPGHRLRTEPATARCQYIFPFAFCMTSSIAVAPTEILCVLKNFSPWPATFSSSVVRELSTRFFRKFSR